MGKAACDYIVRFSDYQVFNYDGVEETECMQFNMAAANEDAVTDVVSFLREKYENVGLDAGDDGIEQKEIDVSLMIFDSALMEQPFEIPIGCLRFIVHELEEEAFFECDIYALDRPYSQDIIDVYDSTTMLVDTAAEICADDMERDFR